MYEAVIFDMDGTLIHTMPEYRYIFLGKALEKFGKTATREFLDGLWFQGNREEKLAQIGIPYLEFWKEFGKYSTPEAIQKYLTPYADVDVLAEIKQKHKIGVVSGALEERLHFAARLIGEQHFDVIIAANEFRGIQPKPHPQGINKCMAKLGVLPGETMYVGNADEDVLAGQAAGVLDVLINRGEHHFPGIKPTITITSLYELLKILK